VRLIKTFDLFDGASTLASWLPSSWLQQNAMQKH